MAWGDPVEKIENWFKDTLAEMAQNSLVRASETIGGVVDATSDSISKTPKTWNPDLFESLQNVSDVAIVPIAVGIMSIIICYDLITACMDRNNMKEFDTSIFFRFIIKAWVAIYFINNVFSICGALIELGSDIAEKALGTLFTEEQQITLVLKSEEFKNVLTDCSLGDVILTGLLSLLVYIISLAVMVIVLIVTAGRMIEILIYFCAAPIPFATFTNKEWSNVGFSFLKNIVALALQGFFIVITLAIYVILFNLNVTNITTDFNSLSGALFNWICYSIVCCFMLLKTGSISKSILGTH